MLAAGTAVGPYVVERLIGSGGVSEVFAARDTRRDDQVALKVIPARAFNRVGARERFEADARDRQRLAHPSIVRILGYGSIPGGAGYVAMELVEGEDLRHLLAHDGPMEPAAAVAILRAVCGGVEAAHRAGIVHGDLKPENVMLPREGTPAKIVDFLGTRRIQSDGTIVGTPAYMAPEQLRGEPVTPRSDVFSLGVLAFEILTGRLPFGRGGAGDVLLMQARGIPDPEELGIDHALADVVRSALARDPDHRPPSASAFARLLESAA